MRDLHREAKKIFIKNRKNIIRKLKKFNFKKLSEVQFSNEQFNMLFAN